VKLAMSPDEVERVDAARSGDPVAIEALLRGYHRDVERLAHRLCATPQDAEDALQETLWIVSRQIGALRASLAISAWLAQIVRRECRRLLRRRRHELLTATLPEPGFEHWQMACGHFAPWELAAAIAQLAPTSRAVLVMRDVEGRSAAEVGAALGLSVAAVKSRLHRARAQVRGILTEAPSSGAGADDR